MKFRRPIFPLNTNPFGRLPFQGYKSYPCNLHILPLNVTQFKMSESDSAAKRFVWIDCEVYHIIALFSQKMTGLNLSKDKIIEIVVLIMNKDLQLLDSQGF